MDKTNKNLESEVDLLRKRIAVLEELNAHYKEIEERFSEAREYAQNIVETVREPLIIMDGELKVISANKAFYKTFQVNSEETQGQFIYDLGNGQWDIPDLRKLLIEVITKKDTLDDFEITHKFETIGEKTMLLNARRIPPTPAKPRIILLAIEDVTEYKNMQREVSMNLTDKVNERTKQLDVVNSQLKEKISELEIFNKAAIGRELRLMELEKEIKELRDKTERHGDQSAN